MLFKFRLLTFLFVFTPLLLAAQNINLTQAAVVTFTNQSLANVWGYSAGGKEYALVGARNGMVIVDITIPSTPVTITTIPGPSNLWKEIKTYNNYAYIVSEGGFGVQVVDLTNLPGSNLAYQSVYPVIPGVGTINSSHALHVDVTKGYLYLYGSKLTTGTGVGYPIICNLNGAANSWTPAYVGRYTANGYAHDGYVDNDMMYAGHIYAGLFSVVNTADKTAPAILGSKTTPNAFTHNTWKSGNSLFTTDETNSSYLTSYDVSDPNNGIDELDRIQLTPGSGSVVHNTYVKDNYAVTSWYRDGIAIVDVTRPANMVVTGKFDTYSGSGSGFDGCWGVYPYFPSGTIIASNIYGTGTNANNGELFILTPTYVRGCYLEGVIRQGTSTGPVVNGVLIELLASGVANETTVSGGLYKMARYGGGTYTMKVSKTGYVTQNIPVTLTTGTLTTQNVVLQLGSLPVTLSSFNAKLQNDKTARLSWETSTELRNKGFDIQQSNDGLTWKSIGFVSGAGTSSVANPYLFTTQKLSAGEWFFRLGQQDQDGTITYSNIRSLTIYEAELSVKISPNPVSANSKIWVNWGSNKGEVIGIQVFSGDMQLVQSIQNIERTGDEQEIPMDTEALSAGRYLIRVQCGDDTKTLQMMKME